MTSLKLLTIGNAVSSERRNAEVNCWLADREFIFDNTNEVKFRQWELGENSNVGKNLTDCIATQMVNNVDTAKDRVQEAILAAMENGETLRIELAVGSRNISFEGYAGCVNTHSERGDWVGVNASLKKVCDKYYTFHELSMNAETQGYIPDKVSEFPFPRTHIDQQIQTHNSHKLLPNSIRPNTKYPNATRWYPKLKHRFYFSSILLLMPILIINLKELKKSQRLDFSCTQAFFSKKNWILLTWHTIFFDKFRDILCHPKFEKMWKWPEKIYMDEIQCPNACENPGRYFVEKFEEKNEVIIEEKACSSKRELSTSMLQW